jgi:hypothetical protein
LPSFRFFTNLSRPFFLTSSNSLSAPRSTSLTHPTQEHLAE